MGKTLKIRVHLPDWLTKMFPHSVWKMPGNEKVVYLTFDDGPVPEVTPAIIDILNRYNIKATFFCVGENVVKYPEVYQQIIENGHTTGNHTFNHIKGLSCSKDYYIKNVDEAARLINSNLFRPPYGLLKQSQFNTLRKRYNIIMWDVISCDYDKGLSPKSCISNVMDYVREGSIITFHDSVKAKTNVLESLPEIIERLKHEGFSFNKIKFPNKQKPVVTPWVKQLQKARDNFGRKSNRA
ncbi:MAG: polysaccharide deacetylase family protein [Prolixibacteraceae bacterium]|nr:polysaccharide deacetylase family protein [Prolixibacteraceae bacterium]